MERGVTSRGLLVVLSLCRSSTGHLTRQRCFPLQTGLTPLCGKRRVTGGEMFEFWVALRSWLLKEPERQGIVKSLVSAVPGADAEWGLGGRGGARSFPAPDQPMEPEENHQITQHNLHHSHFLLASVRDTNDRTLLFLAQLKWRLALECGKRGSVTNVWTGFKTSTE